MQVIDEIFKKLPEDSQEALRYIWESLPASERKSLQTLLGGVPTEANLIRLLLSLSTVQVKLAFGQKHKIAIVGPANVGKSTLYNQFILHKQDKAEVSPVPGTTRDTQQADTGLFTIIDTPGTDAVGILGERERSLALHAAGDADFLIIMFDAIQGIKRSEVELYQQLVQLDKPYLVVLNKIDLVRRDLVRIISKAAEDLSIQPEQMIAIAAKDGKNLEQILMAIAVTEPQLVVALGKAMPEFRWQLAWKAIVSAASVSAVIALTPLPMIDFAPLILTQSIMVIGIARIYNYEITFQRARELIATFGLGFLGRTLFQELSKFGGIPGWLLSAAIASSTTVVMGFGAVKWFETGQKLSGQTLRDLSKRLTTEMLTRLSHLGKRRPSKKAFQEQVAKALESTAIGDNQTTLLSTAGDIG